MIPVEALNYFRVLWSPLCFQCKHYIGQKGKMTCEAYPDEIPDKYVLVRGVVHDTVQEDQVGDYVFTDQAKS